MAEQGKEDQEIEYYCTDNFPQMLESIDASLFVTSCQSHLLFVLSADSGKLTILKRRAGGATGIALNNDQMALYSADQILLCRKDNNIKSSAGMPKDCDLIFSQGAVYRCGDIRGHEMAFIGGRLCCIATKFNCVCYASEHLSFEPFWKPRFISSIVPEDRCHLNGFAVAGEQIRFLTAVSTSDTNQDWKNHKQNGGVIIDFESSEIVSSGLSMPHSPRLYRGELWVLNSGEGQLEKVNLHSCQREVVVKLPGFLRGLAFYKNFAFVGLSSIRNKGIFGGLEIERQARELQCAIFCIDLERGMLTAYIRFTKGIDELFDIQVMPGIKRPYLAPFERDSASSLDSLNLRLPHI